eukprot:UN24277
MEFMKHLLQQLESCGCKEDCKCCSHTDFGSKSDKCQEWVFRELYYIILILPFEDWERELNARLDMYHRFIDLYQLMRIQSFSSKLNFESALYKRNHVGNTPLHIFTLLDRPRIIRWLLDLVSDSEAHKLIKVLNSDNQSSYDIAVRLHHYDVKKIFEEYLPLQRKSMWKSDLVDCDISVVDVKGKTQEEWFDDWIKHSYNFRWPVLFKNGVDMIWKDVDIRNEYWENLKTHNVRLHEIPYEDVFMGNKGSETTF